MTKIPTPFLLIDEHRVLLNLARMAEYGRDRGLRIRPHIKTHKSRRLAQMQLEAGACGLTTAKVGELEIMTAVCSDFLIAYPAIDLFRTARIASLAEAHDITVAIDSPYGADRLGASAVRCGSMISILVDVDVGMHRTGVQKTSEALALGRHVDMTPGLSLKGLMFYPGHVWEPPESQSVKLSEIAAKIDEVLDLWRKSGLNCETVSGGSTPTAYQSAIIPSLTEIRPGTYIYNDMNTVRGGFCRLEECAATIITTVVSTAVPGQVVVDAGSKTLTTDICIPAPDSGYGHVLDYPCAKIESLSEEHGVISVRHCDRAPKLGEEIRIIPNHICPCINLHDSVYLNSAESVTVLDVDARGNIV